MLTKRKYSISDIEDIEWLNSVIDLVIQINLEFRTDRKEEVESELSIFFDEKVVRLPAVQNNVGCVGCAKSHLLALEEAMKRNAQNCLIVEDDFVWIDFFQGLQNFKKLYNREKHWDVICLGTAHAKISKLGRIHEGQTATAYLVNSSYYTVLHENFVNANINLEKGQKERNPSKDSYCIDQHWKLLQKRDDWFVVQPNWCCQRVSQSDNEKKVTNYEIAFKSVKVVDE